ncbi:MAG: hypothetical protein LUQ65_11015 [Candidatus Helarchaeota archaeon]|nr:hypothetical protein [Candidatus Helarchaeota archaeon]
MSKKSKFFSQFEYEFFHPIVRDPNETIFTYIDPWVISYLTPEEKQIAEDLLLRALQQKVDERWLYGVRELKSQKGLALLKELFPQEQNSKNKIMIAETILAIDPNAPESNYMMEVIRSSAENAIKITALYSLRHLLEAELKQKELHNLVLNTLFDSMADNDVKVRKCAYDLLKDHFQLRHFTPKNDPIVTLLTKQESPNQYEQAVSALKEQINNKVVYPFSRRKYIEMVNEITKRPITGEPSSCEVCSKFPKETSADLASHEAIPNKSELEDAITLLSSNNCIKRCPICFRLYKYQYHYFYYIAGQSEEDESLVRCDREGTIELMDEYLKYHVSPRTIVKCGDFLVIE